MMPAKRITIGDILVLTIAFLLVVFFALRPFSGRAGDTCILSFGETEKHFSLSEDRVVAIENNGYLLTVEIRDGRAAVISSDCPDQVCVHTGFISKSGQAVACIPAGVILQITGDTGDEEDFRVG